MVKLLNMAIRAAVLAGEETLKYYDDVVEVTVKDDLSPLTKADLESNRVINEVLFPGKLPVLSEENKQVPYGKRREWNTFWLVDPLDGTKEFINKRSEYTVNIALISRGNPVLGVVYAPVMRCLYYGMERSGSYKQIIDPTAIDCINMKKSTRLSPPKMPDRLRVVASRSHLNEATSLFISRLSEYYPLSECKSYGSSLKLCMVAEGEADIYPRLGPTMEWDTAASHAVAHFAGCPVLDINRAAPLVYNKENLLNPDFVVFNSLLEPVVREIIRKD